ncbi:choice-of-anchor D domain-containing protein [Cystobacter fuscus]|uniref:choice-of-anchor D domain-containing protein n=1 Tax=Cystobacter fuscus TaxID=43 RepID=UPI0037C0F310
MSKAVAASDGYVWKEQGNQLIFSANTDTYCIAKAVLTFEVLERSIAVNPTSLEFGKQQEYTYRDRIVKLTNPGDATLTVSNLAITGTGKDAYSFIDPVDPGTSFTVSAGGSKDIKIRFFPEVREAFPATLEITSNAATAMTPVPLSGEGVEFATALSPASLDFGEQLVGNVATMDVKVTNVGSSQITLSSFSVTGSGFSLATTPSTSIPLEPRAEQTLTVKFEPTSATSAPVSGTLQYSIVGDGTHTSDQVSLLGRGVQPELSFSPGNPLAFGDQRVSVPTTRTLRVTNTGSGPITLNTFTVSGGNGAFSLVTPPASPVPLSANGGFQDFTVRFLPTVEGAVTGGKLTFATSDKTRYTSVDVSLTGNGVKPTLSFNPGNPLAFGDQRVSVAATKTLRVTNTGSSAITLNTFVVSGSNTFSLVTPPASPVPLAANGGYKDFTVQFLPTNETAVSGKLTFTTSDSTDYASVEVSLTGKGVKPLLSVNSGGPLAFGDQRVSVATTKTFRVTNSGSGPITLNTFVVTEGDDSFSLVTPPTSPVVLNASGGYKDFTVRFLPTTETAVSGKLTFTTSDSTDYASVEVALTGKGVKPTLAFDPGNAIPFGDQRVSVATTRTLRVTNTGSSAITLNTFVVSGSSTFSLVSAPTAAVPLAANGGYKEFTVRFLPTTETAVSGKLTFTTSDNTDYASVEVALTGRGIKPTLSFDPGSTLAFGDQRVDAAATKTLRVTNTGSAPITLNTFVVSSGSSFFSLVSPPVSAVTLDANGGFTEFMVQFVPTTETAVSGKLTFTTSDSTDYASVDVTLTGKGVRPAIQVSPEALDFQEQRVGAATSKTLRVTNNGSGSITLNTFVVSGGDGTFSLVSPPTAAVALAARGGFKDFTVKFLPTSEADVTGTLTFTTSDPGTPNIPVSLVGKGVNPILQVSTTSIAFDPQDVGVASATPKKVVLTNTGSGTLHITSIRTTGPFSVTPAPSVDVAGEPKELLVTFTPTVLGDNQGTLQFNTGDPNPDKATVNLPLSGTGVRTLSVSLPSLDFGPIEKGKYKDLPLVFTNNSTSPILLQPLAFPPSSPFSCISHSSPVELKPGSASVTMVVRFAPRSRGDFSEVVTVASNATNSLELNVSGKGTAPIIKFVLPTTEQFVLDFSNVNLNDLKPLTVRIENTGDARLTLSTNAITTDTTTTAFTVSAPTKYELEPAGPGVEPIEVTVSFRPTSSGRLYSKLKVVSNAVTSPAELTLSGTGVAPEIQVADTPIDFGSQKVLTESSSRPLVISNPGMAELRINGISVDPNFIVTPSNVPWIISGGESKTVQLSFNPKASGPLSGFLSIFSNASNKASPVKVAVSGLGVDGFPECQGGCNITFPNLSAGSAHTESLSIANTIKLVQNRDSTIGLVLRSYEITVPSGENPFSLSGFTPNTPLTPGEIKTFSVKFMPTMRGTYKGTLTFETDSSTTPRLNVTLEGTAAGPQVQVASMVDFGKVNMETSRDMSLSVTNMGELPLKIQRIDFAGKLPNGGGAADDMALDYSSSLAAEGITVSANGGTGIIPLKFAPRAVGLREARAIIISNTNPVSVDLRGEGTSQSLVPERLEVPINGVLVGTASPEETIRIFNEGNAPVDIESIRLSEPEMKAVFNIYPTLEPTEPHMTIAAGGSLSLYVSFKPTEQLPVALTWLEVKPVGTRLQKAIVRLSGNGILHPVTAPSMMAFGKQLLNEKAVHDLTLTNLSNTRVNVRDVLISGEGCSQFTVDPLRESIPAWDPVTKQGGTANLKVNFQPRSTGTTVTCQMTISFIEFFKNPVTVTLSGEGIPAVLSIEPMALDFGGVRAGDTRKGQLLFKNLGSDPITLEEPEVIYSVGTPFELDPNPLGGLSIKPGESKVVTVSYQPKTGVDLSSETTLGFKTPAMPQTIDVSLKGKATQRILSVDPGLVDFEQVDVDSNAAARASRTVTVRNISSQNQLVVVTVSNPEGPFRVVTDGLSSGIPAQGSATFTVTFSPGEAGEIQDEILLRLQDATEPEVRLPVKGAGRTLVGRGAREGCSSSGGGLGGTGLFAMLALVGLHALRRRRV